MLYGTNRNFSQLLTRTEFQALTREALRSAKQRYRTSIRVHRQRKRTEAVRNYRSDKTNEAGEEITNNREELSMDSQSEDD